MRLIAFTFISTLVAVSACAPSHTRAVDTDKILVDIREGDSIQGRYDPAGFSSGEARKMAAWICKGDALARYSETAVDGQIVFDVQCKDGNKFGEIAGVSFQRESANSVIVVATHSINDQLAQSKGKLSL